MNDYLNQVGRPPQGAHGNPMNSPMNHSGPKSKKPKFNFNMTKAGAAALLISIAILLIALAVYLFVFKDNRSTILQVKGDQYQAVFLNSADGQVYFGKLRELNKDYFTLSDIYYVRVETVQPDDGTQQAKQNISLAKLGNEIHGPEDVMYINKDSVMFFENLKEDGQVVTAIREYQTNGEQTPSPTPTPAATTTPTPTPAAN
jgi:hypothetical protein